MFEIATSLEASNLLHYAAQQASRPFALADGEPLLTFSSATARL